MNQIHILLVEDNEGDIFLTTEALNEGKIVNKVSIARDGKEALDFLEKKGDFENTELPDLILLDINLPRINGHEVLRYIKENVQLKLIPVIMLTTSSSEKDINQAYANSASSYNTKPFEMVDFMDSIAKIEDFGISIVKVTTKKSYYQ